MESSTLEVALTSAAIALGCVGFAYVYYKQKYGLQDAEHGLKHLTITTITTEDICNEVVSELKRRSKFHRALGFDCEWVTENGKRQPVALVQLSSHDGYCGLFRLSNLKCVPDSLKALLEDDKIYKVGVAPIDDAKYLHSDYSVSIKSTLDVRHISQLCDYSVGGLGSLSKMLLRVVLDKSWRIRCSNWEAHELSERQTRYAAADAYVAVQIFVKLVNEYSRGYLLSWLLGDSRDVWTNLDDLCWKYTDVSFKTKQKDTKDCVKDKCLKKNRETLVIKKKYPYAIRSKPLYQNCFLEAPDGELLCTCDSKKALWYVAKGLADMVKEEPLTVRLHFEPSGRSVGDVGKYYQLMKENKCVVCGATNSYIRKKIVPREYRKCFPEIMKDHSSHDVVLLCSMCHQRSNMLDQAVRERLANMCAAPIAAHIKYNEDVAGKTIPRRTSTRHKSR